MFSYSFVSFVFFPPIFSFFFLILIFFCRFLFWREKKKWNFGHLPACFAWWFSSCVLDQSAGLSRERGDPRGSWCALGRRKPPSLGLVPHVCPGASDLCPAWSDASFPSVGVPRRRWKTPQIEGNRSTSPAGETSCVWSPAWRYREEISLSRCGSNRREVNDHPPWLQVGSALCFASLIQLSPKLSHLATKTFCTEKSPLNTRMCGVLPDPRSLSNKATCSFCELKMSSSTRLDNDVMLLKV